jgi:hypothetical protein
MTAFSVEFRQIKILYQNRAELPKANPRVQPRYYILQFVRVSLANG